VRTWPPDFDEGNFDDSRPEFAQTRRECTGLMPRPADQHAKPN